MQDRGDSWRLQFIKSHIDSHGIGCAIVDDHVVISPVGRDAGEKHAHAEIRRVKSFDEACRIIGCRCADPE